MNEETAHMVFKDGQGKILSVAEKIDVGDEQSDLKITLSVSSASEVKEVSEADFKTMIKDIEKVKKEKI